MYRLPAGPPEVDLSIIVVSYHVRELLRRCLQSIAEGQGDLDVQIIVVDSGSDDGSAEMVSSEFPHVTLIARQENVGFPRGNNLGLSRALGRHVLLLNPDTIVVGEALSQMVSYLDDHRRVGALGPQLRYPGGQIQSSRRRFPTVATAFFESTWLEPWAPQRLLARYRMLDHPDDETVEVDWVVGAALMVRREVVRQVGFLDEGYFMYSEELDWCHRIRDAGWKVVYLPAAQVIHYVGKSSEQAVTARHIHFQRAKLRYFRKYHGRAVSALLRAFLLLSYLWQMILEALKGLLGHKRQLRWQRVASYWQVIKSGLRPAGY